MGFIAKQYRQEYKKLLAGKFLQQPLHTQPHRNNAISRPEPKNRVNARTLDYAHTVLLFYNTPQSSILFTKSNIQIKREIGS